MRFTFVLSKFFVCLVVLTFLSACGGGGGNGGKAKEELFILTISGPDSVYSWQPIDVTVTSNKLEGEYYCQWTYDQLSWSSSSNGECTHIPEDIAEDTRVTLRVIGFYKGEEITYEHDIDITYQYYINHNQRIVADYALLTQNQSINLADSSFDLAELVVNSPKNQTLDCQAEGHYTISFYDNNADLIVSTGDEIKVDFQSCFFKSMGTTVNGQLNINIEQVSEAGQPSGMKVTPVDLVINVSSSYQVEDVIVDGDFSVSRSQTDMQTITNLNADELSFHAQDEQTLHLTNLTTEKNENYETGQLQLQMSVNIEQKADSGFYSVNYTSPLNSFFGSYPSSGEIKITNLENSEDLLFITATELGRENEHFQLVDIEQETFMIDAADRNGQATYSLSTLEDIYIKKYREDDLRLLGITKPKGEYEVMDSFTFILSQPISSIDGQVHFLNMTTGGNQTLGSVEFSGTKITGTPNEFLLADSEYRISLPALTTQTGISERGFSLFTNIRTSNSIVPVIYMSQGYFSEVSTPILSGIQSELNDGTKFSYLWQTSDGANVIFDTKTEMETGIQISSDVTQDINLQLTMTNDLGNRAIVEKPLRYLDTNASYMLIVGSDESYVAQGESWPLNAKDGEFSLSTKPYSEAEKTLSFVSIQYEGLDYWSLDIEAPMEGKLEVGRYEGATRFPFQDEDVAGLSFSGQSRGCNSSFSDFEIYEIEFDNEMNLIKLAMDFDHACEQSTRKRLQGVVRINSDYPMQSN